MTTMNRRTFLGGLGAASALTIVPRRVLGGPGFVPPSDMILLAQVGCGTQAQRQVNTGLVKRPDLQFVAVVDPNKDSQDYVDWGPGATGTTSASSWATRRGAPATRASAPAARSRVQIMETYYGKQNRPSRGIRAYEDFREMLEKETDIQGIVNITPDHQHGPINIAALKKGKAAISHKPVASVLYEVRPRARGRPRELGAVASAGLQQQPRSAHARGMDCCRRDRPRARSAQLEQPSVLAAGDAGVPRRPVRPCRPASTGRCGRVPNRIVPIIPAYTFAVYRGWYAYGTGCLGDMGHYSLWQPYRILQLGIPEFVEARPNNDAFVGDNHVSEGGHVSRVAFPKASTVRWRHAATSDRPSVDTFWYDGGMKPPDARRAVRGQRGPRRTRACCSSATRGRSSATSAATSRA